MRKLSISLSLVFIFLAATLSVAQTAETTTTSKKGRPDVPGTFLIELGFNVLQSAPASMDMTLIGSRTVNMYYFRDMPIGNSNFVFMPGLGVGLDRYKFDNDVTLQVDNSTGSEVVSVVDVNDVDLKKSMLITNYFDIPLEFRFYSNPGDKKRSFNAGVGVKGGIRFGALTKLKYKENGDAVKTKEKRNYELNRFRYGVTGRVGIGGFNVFYYQSLSTLFDGNSPAGTVDTSNITVGLSFTGF